mmetsp:Transcript_14066/g.20792  ORF Transcript_14066/g.20792 Transcript_14066/m.20792 type:complete len:92 (-) Transcript_14066:221-496(-)
MRAPVEFPVLPRTGGEKACQRRENRANEEKGRGRKESERNPNEGHCASISAEKDGFTRRVSESSRSPGHQQGKYWVVEIRPSHFLRVALLS